MEICCANESWTEMPHDIMKWWVLISATLYLGLLVPEKQWPGKLHLRKTGCEDARLKELTQNPLQYSHLSLVMLNLSVLLLES